MPVMMPKEKEPSPSENGIKWVKSRASPKNYFTGALGSLYEGKRNEGRRFPVKETDEEREPMPNVMVKAKVGHFDIVCEATLTVRGNLRSPAKAHIYDNSILDDKGYPAESWYRFPLDGRKRKALEEELHEIVQATRASLVEATREKISRRLHDMRTGLPA